MERTAREESPVPDESEARHGPGGCRTFRLSVFYSECSEKPMEPSSNLIGEEAERP